MRIIDFHNHYYPPEYLDALGPSGSCLTITHDEHGNPVVHYPGDYNVMVRGHRDIAYRQAVLDEHERGHAGHHVDDAGDARRSRRPWRSRWR